MRKQVGVFRDLPVFTDDECPPDKIYFLPHGSTASDESTGRTLELLPGYYVNPRQLGIGIIVERGIIVDLRPVSIIKFEPTR